MSGLGQVKLIFESIDQTQPNLHIYTEKSKGNRFWWINGLTAYL